VDTSAQWNFGTGNANNPPYKFGGPTKADGFNLDVVQLRVDKPLDETEWAAGYRVDLWLGPDANTLGTQSALSTAHSDFAIRQAYVELRTPIGTGLDWKIGVFDSIIGYESVDATKDPNFTRSYGHSIEPQTHTGILATYHFTDMISASAGIANSYGPIINERAFSTPADPANNHDEAYKTYMASVAVTAPDSTGFLSGSTFYAGFVNGFNDHDTVNGTANATAEGSSTSYYLGATIATGVTGLSAGASFDYLDVHHINNDTYSVAGYVSYKATEKLSIHGRAEFFKDKGNLAGLGNGQILFSDVAGTTGAKVLSLTCDVQYDLWKNVLSRVELRWDHSLEGNDIFGGSTPVGGGFVAPNAENAWMLAANIIYKF
jgi:hypothetical protein